MYEIFRNSRVKSKKGAQPPVMPRAGPAPWNSSWLADSREPFPPAYGSARALSLAQFVNPSLFIRFFNALLVPFARRGGRTSVVQHLVGLTTVLITKRWRLMTRWHPWRWSAPWIGREVYLNLGH